MPGPWLAQNFGRPRCYARHGRQGLAAESTQTGIADDSPQALYSKCWNLPTRGAGGNLRRIGERNRLDDQRDARLKRAGLPVLTERFRSQAKFHGHGIRLTAKGFLL